MDGAANFTPDRRSCRYFGVLLSSRRIAQGCLGVVLVGCSILNNSAYSQSVVSESNSNTFQPGEVVTSSEAIENVLEKRGSISFRKTSISEVVFLLSDLWKINIVAGDAVGGEVSGVFHDAPLRDVLSSTLTASGFGYRQVGDSLVVLPLDQLNTQSNAQGGSSGSGNGIGGIIQSDIAYFTMQYTDAELLAAPLKEALSTTTIVAVYPEENRLMVKGTADEIRIATDAISQLDIPRQQVRITVLIYDVSLNELERLGVNWSRNIRPPVDTGSAVQTFSATATFDSLAPDGATSLALRSLSDNFDAALLLQALDQNTEAKLLANPSITVSDRHEASMQIVQRLPIIAADPVAGSNAVFAQVTFVDAGVILRVTPRISRDGTIEMNVHPEFSVKVGETNGNPIIDSRTAQTTVRVNDGSTFALGGLRQKSISETVNGVPWLKDRKYIGALFRSHNTEVKESELIVFLKPEMVDTYGPNRPREDRAACVATVELDAIPYADHCPQSPYCRDPYCPNHVPRPRINGGTKDLEMLGGEGVSDFWVPNSEGHGPVELIELAPQANVSPENSALHVARQDELARLRNKQQVSEPSADAFPPVHVETSYR